MQRLCNRVFWAFALAPTSYHSWPMLLHDVQLRVGCKEIHNKLNSAHARRGPEVLGGHPVSQ